MARDPRRNLDPDRAETAPAADSAASQALDGRELQVLDAGRLDGVRRGFATRRAELPDQPTLLTGDVCPRPGDLLLAQVSGLGQHTRIELPNGRRSQLYRGDEIIVAYGHRYAPDQFEAEVPADLGECHLVAAGGIASRMVSKHSRVKSPTRITPLGLLARPDGTALNLDDWRLDSRPIPKPLPPVMVVAGTSMNAGKTTAAANLINGLVRSGRRVGAAKVTGTGAGGDCWQMTDAGASAVVDFTDAGHASTYMLPAAEVEKVFLRLLSHLGGLKLDAIVVEVADGILQQETMDLLASQGFRYYCNRLLLAAADAMGAVSAAHWLQTRAIEISAVSGALTSSPLAMREAASALGLPVLARRELADPDIAAGLLLGAGEV